MKQTVIPLTIAGMIAGLLAAPLAGTGQHDALTAQPLRSLAWGILALALSVGLGAAVGAAGGLLVSLLTRRADERDWRTAAVWVAPLAAGAVVLVASWIAVRGAMAAWADLVVICLLAAGILALLEHREVPHPVRRLVAGGVGVFGGYVFFIVAWKLTRGAQGMPVYARVGGLLVVLALAAVVGAIVHVLATRAAARLPASSRLLRGSAVAGLLAVAAGVIAIGARDYGPSYSFPDATSASPEGPSLILISVDTVRADYVGYMGGPARTPNLDAMADESEVFTQARSVAPWTRPSFAAALSGRYPSEMGVGRIRGAGGAEWDAVTPFTWSADHPLLAQVMRDAGYRTAAVVTNANLVARSGADRGFEVFEHVLWDGVQAAENRGPAHAFLARYFPAVVPDVDMDDMERADVVTPAVRRMLASRPEGGLCLWTHYMDPHAPYDSPDAPEELRVRLDNARSMAGMVALSAPERMNTIAAYVAELEYFDRWLGDLLADLKQSGLWDSSVVVLWSDHGEELWDHGALGHIRTLHDELLHVPLLIHLPGQREGRRRAEHVSLLDLVPTVTELCGVEAPDGLPGRSLVPLLSGGTIEPLECFLESCGFGAIRKGILSGHRKLVYNTYSNRFALYDLTVDPTEQNNLYGTPGAPDTTALERKLLDWTETSLAMMDQYREDTGIEGVPPAVRQHLRDLGYAN